MAPIAVERPHLETGAGGRPLDWMKEQGWRASWARAVLSLNRTAGSASWAPATVLPSTLCCFGNFMKKKGRSGTAGEGQLENIALPVRGGKQAGRWRMRAGGAGWRERRTEWWREEEMEAGAEALVAA